MRVSLALFSAAVWLLPVSCQAESPAPGDAAQGAAPAAASGSEEEKTLYALGFALSRNLGRFQLTEAELDAVFQGLRDGALGREPEVELDTYGPRIQQLAEERTAAVASAEREASAGFLSAEAAAEGATTAESGLIKRVIEPGEGAQPAATDTVRVHYHGTLRDGTVFDSSVERGEPVTFPLNRVIPCWTEALQTMKVGEKAHITCPAEIAYGDRGAPPRIQPGAALAFDVELIEVVAPPEPAPQQ